MTAPAYAKRDALALTPYQERILRFVACGLSNRQIAERLNTPLHRVRTQLELAFDKIGTGNRTRAALWAIRSGLVSVEGAWHEGAT